MGIERLLVALDAEGIDISQEETIDVYVMNLGKEVLESSFQFAALCRQAGYRTELDYTGRSFKAQFKSVERKNAKVVIMVGENELKEGKVALKNIATQEQVAIPIGELVHQLDHWLDEDHVCDHEHKV
jgi:histidyl-tRNA synthetase